MVSLTSQSAADSIHQHHTISESPGFFELWNVDVFLFSLVIIVLYFLLVGKWRAKIPGATPVAASRQVYFLLGMILFISVKATPVDYYGHHYLFSVHMLQMAVVFLVVPPLLLLGLKDWMIKPLIKGKTTKKIFVFLTHPLVSIVLFNMFFSLYHVPYVFDNLMALPYLNLFYYGVLFLGAVLMWWPLMDILHENKIGGLWKIAYMVGNSILITPVCALIIFSYTPFYETYMGVPQLVAALPTLDDQQTGGVIMKVVQEITYILAVAIIFFKWAKEERSSEKEADQLVWANQARAFSETDATTEGFGKGANQSFSVSGARPSTDSGK